ncbi:hypothetical protein GVAV_001176 [Gurleya vavrai]
MTQTIFTMTIVPLLPETDMSKVITYLRHFNIFSNIICCLSCNQTMRQVSIATATDAYAFRCYNKTCDKYGTHRSIRTGSFLDEFSISKQKFIHFLYLFSLETSVSTICELIGISRSLVHKITSKIRLKI